MAESERRYIPLGMKTDLKQRSIKVSDQTWERWQAFASVASVSVTALIVKSVDGYSGALTDLAVVRAEVDSLQGDVAQLKRELAASRQPAAAAVPVGKSAPIDRKTHHPAGPVRASAVPSNITGQAVGFNLKGMKA